MIDQPTATALGRSYLGSEPLFLVEQGKEAPFGRYM
jgi:hypothetical protein